jgi:hypothetical protein
MKIKLFIFIIVISFLVSIPHAFGQVEIPYLETWENIDDLNFNELQEKYRELFTFTKPFIVREGVKKLVIPTGVPDIYGEELGVAFVPEHADRMIMLLKQFEDDKLNEEQMASYMRIGMRTSCEYCCRVKTLVKPMSKGIRACGCAHSYAMRGLIKYLILNHSDKYTEDEILAEVNRWKTLFFPKQSIHKVIMAGEGTGTIDPSVLQEMPNMVGGC